MWHLIACIISVSLPFLNWIKTKIKWFLSYFWINVGNINSEIRTTNIISFPERETNWNFTGCQVPPFMTVLIPHILFNVSWMIKCLFLRTMEPLKAWMVLLIVLIILDFKGTGHAWFFSAFYYKEASFVCFLAHQVPSENVKHTCSCKTLTTLWE